MYFTVYETMVYETMSFVRYTSAQTIEFEQRGSTSCLSVTDLVLQRRANQLITSRCSAHGDDNDPTAHGNTNNRT